MLNRRNRYKNIVKKLVRLDGDKVYIKQVYPKEGSWVPRSRKHTSPELLAQLDRCGTAVVGHAGMVPNYYTVIEREGSCCSQREKTTKSPRHKYRSMDRTEVKINGAVVHLRSVHADGSFGAWGSSSMKRLFIELRQGIKNGDSVFFPPGKFGFDRGALYTVVERI